MQSETITRISWMVNLKQYWVETQSQSRVRTEWLHKLSDRCDVWIKNTCSEGAIALYDKVSELLVVN